MDMLLTKRQLADAGNEMFAERLTNLGRGKWDDCDMDESSYWFFVTFRCQSVYHKYNNPARHPVDNSFETVSKAKDAVLRMMKRQAKEAGFHMEHTVIRRPRKKLRNENAYDIDYWEIKVTYYG